jgi:hypothetical protein
MCGIVKDNSFSIFANMITKSISAVLMAVDRNDKIIKLQYDFIINKKYSKYVFVIIIDNKFICQL